MTIWDTTTASGGSGSGASWSSTNAGAGYILDSTSGLVPAGVFGSTLQKVWFYLKTNVTSTDTDPIRAYLIDSSGTTKATSANSVSRADITTSFVLHEFTFDVTVTIADTDNIVVGFTGASGSGALQFDAASGNTEIRTFAGFSPATLYGPWSGQYRFKLEYGSSPSPGSSGTLLPPPPAMVRL